MEKLLNIEKNKKQNLRKVFESKGKIISMYDIWKHTSSGTNSVWKYSLPIIILKQ